LVLPKNPIQFPKQKKAKTQKGGELVKVSFPNCAEIKEKKKEFWPFLKKKIKTP
jgi:hypothetical protein